MPQTWSSQAFQGVKKREVLSSILLALQVCEQIQGQINVMLAVLGGECIQVACVPSDLLATDLQYATAGINGSLWDILPRIMLYYLGKKNVSPGFWKRKKDRNMSQCLFIATKREMLRLHGGWHCCLSWELSLSVGYNGREKGNVTVLGWDLPKGQFQDPT